MFDLTVFRVTFDRIGRYFTVAPVHVIAETSTDVERQIHHYARPMLFSQSMHVAVDLDEMRGRITVGEGAGRLVSSFTIEPVDQAVDQPAASQGVAGAAAP